jgi:hypothetical protein
MTVFTSGQVFDLIGDHGRDRICDPQFRKSILVFWFTELVSSLIKAIATVFTARVFITFHHFILRFTNSSGNRRGKVRVKLYDF